MGDGIGDTQDAGSGPLVMIRRFSDPWQWSSIDRCLVWLALALTQYVPYMLRIGHLLARPDVEPYFSRPVLAVYRAGLAGLIVASLLLLVYALVMRGRRPDHPWLPYAVTQLYFLWIAASAYVLGPLTTPTLGLVGAAVFMSALLFKRAVVVTGLVSALLLLAVTTLAERAGVLPYAPLFAGAPVVDGRLSDPYVVGTGLAALALMVSSAFLALFLVERSRVREAELLVANSAQRRTAEELEEALESLRDSEERFRQLAENAHEVFWMMDAVTGRLLYVSPTFETMWGLALAPLYERMDQFLNAVHPEDRERVARRVRQFSTIQTKGLDYRETEYRIVRPTDGQERWVSVRGFPIRDQKREVYRIGGLIEDVTERKATEMALRQARLELEKRVEERTAELLQSNRGLQEEATERARAERALRRSEEQLRQQFVELEQIYDTAPIGLGLFDTALRYVRINERLAAINGHPVDAHIGRSVREIIPDISDSVAPYLKEVMETGTPRLNLEVTGTTPAEPEVVRRWLTSYFPLKGPDGDVIGVSCVVQDISERVWAEERARRHLEDLAHVARLSTMGEMAAGIAHELNQPLTAMANYAFIGQHTVDGRCSPEAEQLRGLFKELSEQALRAGDIVHHLRDFVRKRNPQRAMVSVNDMVRDSLTLVASELRLGGVRSELELGEELPLVHADAIQIQQVILNLLRNAVEAMAEVVPEKRLLTINTLANGDGVDVAVSDTGLGFSAGDNGKLFDAFFTTKAEGMGMGLAISRSIVEDHGGRLWGESRPAGGAIFRFNLPRARDGYGRS